MHYIQVFALKKAPSLKVLNFNAKATKIILQIHLCFLDTKALLKILFFLFTTVNINQTRLSGRHCQKNTQSCYSKQTLLTVVTGYIRFLHV